MNFKSLYGFTVPSFTLIIFKGTLDNNIAITDGYLT